MYGDNGNVRCNIYRNTNTKPSLPRLLFVAPLISPPLALRDKLICNYYAYFYATLSTPLVTASRRQHVSIKTAFSIVPPPYHPCYLPA